MTPNLIKLFHSLPRDRIDIQAGSSKLSTINCSLENELIEQLICISRDESISVAEFLISGLFALLFHYTREEKLAVTCCLQLNNKITTTPWFPKYLQKTISTCSLSVFFSGDDSISALLQNVSKVTRSEIKSTHTEKIDHSNSPNLKLNGGSPPILIRIVDESESGKSSVFDDEIDAYYNGFELFINIVKKKNDVHLRFGFNTKRYRKNFIMILSRQFQCLLESASQNPRKTVAELDLMSADEKVQIRNWSVGEQASQTLDDTIAFFRHHVEQTPDRIAVEFEGGRLTYAELNKLVNKQAQYLRKQGVRRNVPVGICLPRSLDCIVAVLGTLAARGAVFLIDLSAPISRQCSLLQIVAPAVVITTAEHRSRLPVGRWKFFCFEESRDSIEQFSSTSLVDTQVNAGDMAFLLTTSGSTGEPKIVIEPIGYRSGGSQMRKTATSGKTMPGQRSPVQKYCIHLTPEERFILHPPTWNMICSSLLRIFAAIKSLYCSLRRVC